MANSKMSAFQYAIENTPEVKNGYYSGIKAVKSIERPKINPSQPDLLDGSLDIDTCTQNLYPNDTRWDYAISYKGKVCFFEIHPAYEKEIKKMESKIQWLRTWLKNKAPKIASLPRVDKPFCWVPSGKTGFLSMSTARKKIALLGISFEKKLELK